MKLESTGRVTYTRHQVCTFHSSFDLSTFPFDAQTLPLKRMSFAYSPAELNLYFSSSGCFQPDPTIDYTSSLWALPNLASCQNPTLPANQAIASLYIVRMWQSYVLKMIVPMFILVFLSTLTYWVDYASPPARVGMSVALVLAIVTFNSTVSADLPKINYSTLLDWYVWKCFLFVIAGLGEFALVNHIAVNKMYPIAVAKLVDDYFQWTAPGTWIMSNIIFWPFVSSPIVNALFGIIMLSYILGNAYRVYWCYRNETGGMWKPFRHMCRMIYWISNGKQGLKPIFVNPPPKPAVSVPAPVIATTTTTKPTILPSAAVIATRTIDIHGDKNPFEEEKKTRQKIDQTKPSNQTNNINAVTDNKENKESKTETEQKYTRLDQKDAPSSTSIELSLTETEHNQLITGNAEEDLELEEEEEENEDNNINAQHHHQQHLSPLDEPNPFESPSPNQSVQQPIINLSAANIIDRHDSALGESRLVTTQEEQGGHPVVQQEEEEDDFEARLL